MGNDQQLSFFFSGQAHAFYAILGVLVLAITVAFGANKELTVVIAALAGGVFADIWAHGYQH
jgi:uncharacterized membrane protein YjjB (DUF3815 family)